jgi:hypothetical protein
VTLGHACPLYKIHSVLALGEKEPLWRACDDDAEEVVQIAEIRHGKLRVESRRDAL